MKTFKKSIPNIQRFFETKLEVNLQDQEMEFQEKEKEIDDLQEQVKSLEEDILETKSWFKKAVEMCTNLGNELKRPYISRSMLREERKYLEEFYDKAVETEMHEKLISDFRDGMHVILDYVAMAEDRAAQLEHTINCGEENENNQSNCMGSSGMTITAKVQSVMDLVANVMEKAVVVVKPEEENDVRNELEKSIGKLKDIIKDLRHVKQIFLLTLRKKEDLSQETLSLVNNFREIRRLEQELNEQEKHVQDLKKRGQTIKIKSKKHKRQQEQIQESIDQKEKTLTELHDSLQKQVSSADQRVHFILSLLPDCVEGEEDNKPMDTSWHPFSRGGTSLTIYPDRSDSRFSLRSDTHDDTPSCPTVRSATPDRKPTGHHNCSSPHTPTPAITKLPEVPARKMTDNRSAQGPKHLPSVRERPLGSPLTPRDNKSTPRAEKVSRETISAAQKRLPATSPPVPAQPRTKFTTKPQEQLSRPKEKEVRNMGQGSPGRPPEKPPENPSVGPLSRTSRRVSPLPSQKDLNKLRASTPDDKKDENQEKTDFANNIIKVKTAQDEHKLKFDLSSTKESTGDRPTQANSPPVLTKQLTQAKAHVPDKGSSTPAATKYTEKPLVKDGPLSISSAKTVTHPPMQGVKTSVGFDKAYSRPAASASKTQPIQTQHADLKVETQIMLKERTGRGLRTTKMNGIHTEEKDTSSQGLSARVQSSVPDRDSFQQSWMVRSVAASRTGLVESDTLASTSGSTYPPTKKPRTKVDNNRLGSNLDMIKDSKSESFYGRVTDAINKVKRIEPPSTSPSINTNQPQTNVFTFQDSQQSRLSLSTQSSDGQNVDYLANGAAVSDESHLDHGSLPKAWDTTGYSGRKGQAFTVDSDFEDSLAGQRATSSTSRVSRSLVEDANRFPPRQVLTAKKVELK